MKIDLRKRLILSFLVVGVLPLLALGGVAFVLSKRSIEKENFNLIHTINTINKQRIEDLFNSIRDQAQTYASLDSTAHSLAEFSRAFEAIGTGGTKDSLKRFYTKQFTENYRKLNADSDPAGLGTFVAELSPRAQELQSGYIADVSDTDKSRTVRSQNPSLAGYDGVHATFHQQWRSVLSQNGYYDLFLVNSEGVVVYSVFKEIDFGASLMSPSLSASPLAEAYQAAIAEPMSAQVGRLGSYFPSFDQAAMFVAKAVKYDGGKTGAIIIQVPVKKILSYTSNNLNYEGIGLGETGDTIILSSQQRLISSPRWFLTKKRPIGAAKLPPETERKVVAREDFALLLAVERQEVKEFLGSAKEYGRYVNIWGDEVIASKMDISLGSFKWTIMTEMQTAEAFASLYQLLLTFALIVGLSVLGILLVSLWVGNRLSGQLRRLNAEIFSYAKALRDSSGKLGDTSNTLSQAVVEQASSLQETVSSLDEIKSMVERNNEFSQKSRDVSKQSTVMARKGNDLIEEMIQAIGRISRENERIRETFGDITQSIREVVQMISDIKDKTKVINDIVFQTKLLSFNASVEAARSGEHGKGFAVVAEEVGSLAEMSGRSADEISAMLDQSVDKVQRMSERTQTQLSTLIESVSTQIEAGNRVALDCGKILKDIVGDVNQVEGMIAQIAQSSEQQTVGVREINQAMNMLDSATQQNSTVATDSAREADEIRAQSQGLEKISHELQGIVEG